MILVPIDHTWRRHQSIDGYWIFLLFLGKFETVLFTEQNIRYNTYKSADPDAYLKNSPQCSTWSEGDVPHSPVKSWTNNTAVGRLASTANVSFSKLFLSSADGNTLTQFKYKRLYNFKREDIILILYLFKIYVNFHCCLTFFLVLHSTISYH